MSSEVQHREAFETYMRAQNACVRLARQSEAVGGEYRTTSVQKAWVLWLAAIDRCSSEQAVRAQWAAYQQDAEFVIGEIQKERDAARAERDSAQAEAKRLREALQMLYDETADYIRLNNLGGMDNQCMKLARQALGISVSDVHEQAPRNRLLSVLMNARHYADLVVLPSLKSPGRESRQERDDRESMEIEYDEMLRQFKADLDEHIAALQPGAQP